MFLNLPYSFSDEERMIHDAAASFASSEVAPSAMSRDAEHRFPVELLKPLAELGFFGIKVPSEHGGVGSNTVSYAIALAKLAEACASTCVTVAVCNLFADVLSHFANEEQRERYLKPYLRGKLGAGTFCLSEPGNGSDASAMKTSATLDGDTYILNGAKQWITNGAFAKAHIVFAKTAPELGKKGISAFIVDADSDGVSVGYPERKMGLCSSNTVGLTFDNVLVPAANRIGEEGMGYRIALANLDGGRIGIAAQAVGIAYSALQEGLRYASERKVFNQRIVDFQASQFAIADAACDIERSWLLTMQAAVARDTTGKSARLSSMAKLTASESACRVADAMLQLHGGYGYVEDYAIERLYRDARVTRIYEGASEIQRLVIARDILS